MKVFRTLEDARALVNVILNPQEADEESGFVRLPYGPRRNQASHHPLCVNVQSAASLDGSCPSPLLPFKLETTERGAHLVESLQCLLPHWSLQSLVPRGTQVDLLYGLAAPAEPDLGHSVRLWFSIPATAILFTPWCCPGGA